MTDPIDSPPRRLRPTLQKPLLGLTVLVVEDSRYASEAVRQFCLRSGARIRRADCLRAARRHLSVYMPSVILVDLGLPDGSGLDLLASRPRDAEGAPAAPVIAISGDPTMLETAQSSGADAVLAKPIGGLAAFQEAVLSVLPEDRRPKGPRPIINAAPELDPLSLREDLQAASTQLARAHAPGSVGYIARFVEGVGRIAEDAPLQGAARSLRELSARPQSRETVVAAEKLRDLLESRIGALSDF